MEKRIKDLLNSLINQYARLTECKYSGDDAKFAEMKLKRHQSMLESAIKQLINMGTPIFTYDGRISAHLDPDFKIVPEDDESLMISNPRDRVVFARFAQAFMNDGFDRRLANFEITDDYRDFVEAVERQNVEFKQRTTYLLMFSDN